MACAAPRVSTPLGTTVTGASSPARDRTRSATPSETATTSRAPRSANLSTHRMAVTTGAGAPMEAVASDQTSAA